MPLGLGLGVVLGADLAKGAIRLALVIAAFVAVGWLVFYPRIQLRAERAAHAETKAQFERANRDAERAAADRQAEQQAAVDSARGELEHARTEIRRRDADLARAAAATRGLRQSLAAYASPAGAPDAAAACPVRAAVLGELAGEGVELLGEGVELLRACARDHDERAAEVAALLRSWPK